MAYTALVDTALLVLAAMICGHVRAASWNGGCRLSDIKVSVQKTGRLVEEQSEYQVTIANQCSCPQGSIYVRCLGLPSVEPVDGTKIRPVDGQRCLVGGGRFLPRGALITFTYAWKTPQDFTVISAQPHC